MKSLRKIFQRLKTLLWTALTLVTVLAAVIVGIGKLLMPYSVHYQPELEAWLTEAFNQQVRVESFTGEWKAFGPRIRLQGVTFMPEGMQSEIAIKRAALDIKPLNALIPGRPLYSFRIIGADLSLERTLDDRYVLSGLGVSNTASDQDSNPRLRDVALNGEVRLQDVSLSFDEAHAYLEGDEQVYAVEIPPELYQWAEAFILTHYVATKKIKRKLKNWKEQAPEISVDNATTAGKPS